MWNDKKSLLLSKLCVLMFLAALVCCAIFSGGLVRWLLGLYPEELLAIYFRITIYAGCVPAALLLLSLYLLLCRIGSGRVFVERNTKCLRHISWYCFAGAAVSAASSVYYRPWLAVTVAAAFMGLIVRVVKNVFAKAVSLQDDAEFTI